MDDSSDNGGAAALTPDNYPATYSATGQLHPSERGALSRIEADIDPELQALRRPEYALTKSTRSRASLGGIL
jgi:hypothetical protein